MGKLTEVKDSLYEQFCPLTTVAGQHFVEWFTGADIKKGSYPKRWIESNTNGAGTFAMSSSVDGGYEITTGSGGNNTYQNLTFNDIHQFSSTASGFIVVSKVSSVANTKYYMGLENNSYYTVSFNGNESYYRTGTRESSTGSSQTATGVASDNAWHVHKLTTDGTTVKHWIDGVQYTTTSNVPTGTQANFQPFIQVYGNASKTASVRYFEAWNT